MSPDRRAPIAVLVAVVLVGVAGAVAVYLAGQRIGEGDRAAVQEWERSIAPDIETAAFWVGEFEVLREDAAGDVDRVTEAVGLAGDAFARTRATVDALPTPGILEPTSATVRRFIDSALRAAAVLEAVVAEARAPTEAEREALRRELAEAEQQYALAREAMISLRCRARLPSCEATLFPPL